MVEEWHDWRLFHLNLLRFEKNLLMPIAFPVGYHLSKTSDATLTENPKYSVNVVAVKQILTNENSPATDMICGLLISSSQIFTRVQLARTSRA